MSTYKSYKGLPALAGICSLEQAMRPGLSVDDCVSRLKRCHYVLKRLHEIFIVRLTAEPVYELKMGFSLHAHICAEHAAALRVRVGEMREPPLGLEVVPDANLAVCLDEVRSAPGTVELLLGVYGVVLPALQRCMKRHLDDTNPLADHPSVRLCRFALLEIGDMIDFGAQCLEKLADAEARELASGWIRLLNGLIAAAGDLDGSQTPSPAPERRVYSQKPFKYDPVPRRDERFPDPYNMGVNAEVFLYDEKYPPEPKTLMMFYKRLREIDVPEMMASIIAQTGDQPWAYYRDMTRQLWDEARHAMMGEVGFASLDIDWPGKVMVNFTWSLALNTQLKPIERHAVLYFIEQGLMPKNGKRFEWEVGRASKDPLAALFQDYDWADEVLHARIGREWYLKHFANPQEGVKYGDECWSRVLMNWENWRKEGLTQHRNWWPDLYTAACRKWKIDPDPEVLAYDTSYRTIRADLKDLTGSA